MLSIEEASNPSYTQDSCLWDCGWYRSIVENGYNNYPHSNEDGDGANWAFFPLFPILANIASRVFFVSGEKALTLGSVFFLYCSILAFMIYVEKTLGRVHAIDAGVLLAFNPYLMYAYSGYAEPLTFFLCTLCFLALLGRRYLCAGFLGAFLSASRLVGIFFVFPLARNLLSFGRSRSPYYLLLPLLLSPLGLALYMYHLFDLTGDPLAFKNVQISWGRTLVNPLAQAFSGLSQGGWHAWFSFVFLFGVLVGIYLLAIGCTDLALYLLPSVLLPAFYGLSSMPRFVFWQMPFLYGLLLLTRSSRLTRILLLVMAGSFSTITTFYWFLGRSVLN